VFEAVNSYIKNRIVELTESKGRNSKKKSLTLKGRSYILEFGDGQVQRIRDILP
jgi:hypothetical protein